MVLILLPSLPTTSRLFCWWNLLSVLYLGSFSCEGNPLHSEPRNDTRTHVVERSSNITRSTIGGAAGRGWPHLVSFLCWGRNATIQRSSRLRERSLPLHLKPDLKSSVQAVVHALRHISRQLLLRYHRRRPTSRNTRRPGCSLGLLLGLPLGFDDGLLGRRLGESLGRGAGRGGLLVMPGMAFD